MFRSRGDQARADVRINAAAIHRQCGWLDRPATPTDDLAGLCPFKVPVADVTHCKAADLFGLLNRISTSRNLTKHDPCAAASFFDCHKAEAADDLAAALTGGVPVLYDGAFGALISHRDAKAAQLRIPHELTRTFDPISRRFQTFYNAFRDF